MLHCINEEETFLCTSLCANVLVYIGLLPFFKNYPKDAIGSCYLHCLEFQLGRVVGRHIILIKKDLSQQCNEAQVGVGSLEPTGMWKTGEDLWLRHS